MTKGFQPSSLAFRVMSDGSMLIFLCRGVSNQQICFGNGDKGGCLGDSGGPLVCRINSGHWLQIGIVSFGPDVCNDKGFPTVFTRVSSYERWIYAHISMPGKRYS